MDNTNGKHRRSPRNAQGPSPQERTQGTDAEVGTLTPGPVGPAVIVSPDGGKAFVDETLTLTLTGVTTTEGLTVEQSISGLNEPVITEGVITLTATEACTGEIKVKHTELPSGEQSITVVFEALDVITVTSDPVNAEVPSDQEITLTVEGTEKEITVTSDLETIIAEVQDKVITVKATTHGNGVLTIKGRGIQEITQQVNFTELQTMVHTVTPVNREVFVTEEILVEITEPDETASILTENNSSELTIEKDQTNETQYHIRSQLGYQGNVEFTSPGYQPLVVPVHIKELQVFETTPAINETLEFEEDSSVQLRIDPLPEGFVIESTGNHTEHLQEEQVITFTSTSVGEDTITLRGTHFTPKTFTLKVLDKGRVPQFTVPAQQIILRDNQLPYSFRVDNLNTVMSASIDNIIVFNIKVNQNQVTLSKNSDIELQQMYQCKLTLSAPGHQDVVVHVEVQPNSTLPIMPCHGQTLYGFKNEEVYFNTPTLDSDDAITATSADKGLTINIREVNRVYLQSKKEGHFIVKVTHSEYQDALVTYVCNEKPQPTKPLPEAPDEWYDLGTAPSVKIETNPRTFIQDVFTSPSLTTDPERITYVLANGRGDVRGIANLFCSYNQELGSHRPVQPLKEGAQYVRRIYDQLLFVFGTSDYYTFREYMRLIIKIMSHYQENAFSSILMVRYDEVWIGNKEELKQSYF